LKRKIEKAKIFLKKRGFRQTFTRASSYAGWKIKLSLAKFLWTLPPRTVKIIVLNRCNLKCLMCRRTYQSEIIRKDMSFADFKKVVDQFPHTRRFDLTPLAGEGFLHKDFIKMLEYLKTDKKAYVSFASNFTLITPKIAEKLISLHVDVIGISLDGATKETYEEIRVGAMFEKVIWNIRNLIKLKNELKSDTPALEITCVVTKYSFHELPLLVDLTDQLGIGVIHYINQVIEGNTPDLRIEREKLEKIFETASKKAGEKSIFLTFDLFEKPPIKQCPIPWEACGVDLDGTVFLCSCGGHIVKIGNIFEKGFDEIWRSEKMKRIRKTLQKGEVPPECVGCVQYET